MRPHFLAALAALAPFASAAEPDPIAALLARPILAPGTVLTEVQAFTEDRVPAMPPIATLAAWQEFAARTRRDVLDRAVFRDATSRAWRDAPGRVEWLDTIPGGPGYSIRQLRYEALPGLWIPALLYQPAAIAGKIPVHLAVNGHGRAGKASGHKQIRCINLAKRGVASLNVEWFAQGQLQGDGFGHKRMNQLDLCGVSGLAPFYLAMSRALDALLALPFADPARVAVSGLSGGGWQTIVISALDPRVAFANPVAGYSSYRTRARHLSDLGDSEQTPSDLATVADYTHLTALLAGRAALLTYNDRDDCCFATPHALAPLHAAAAPIFRLLGQERRLRVHTNADPGTHNFEIDNRQAFYRALGDEFFPGDAAFDAREIPAQPEVKTAAQLEVPLPAGNLDFNLLALAAAKNLPRPGAPATREKLAEIVRFRPLAATATRAGAETRDGVHASFWQVRLGEEWTVPVTELRGAAPTKTTLLVADAGRASQSARVRALLADGHRVLALDPFYFGESRIPQRDFLFALLVAAVGERPLGVQAAQILAIARWAGAEFKAPGVELASAGPRLGLAAQVAAALEPRAFRSLVQTDALASLHEVLRQSWSVDMAPEFFCFGLLERFDAPQLLALARDGRAR